MAQIGIFYGSTEGNTERIVTTIQEKLGGEDVAVLHNVNSATADDFEPYDILILACPTWEIGELQEDWDSFIDELDDADLAGKSITYVGLGDAEGYPDTFLDALGIIHERIEDSDAEFFGAWPTDGYDFEESKGMIGDKFLGLAIDEDCQKELTEGRIDKWVAQIKEEISIEA